MGLEEFILRSEEIANVKPVNMGAIALCADLREFVKGKVLVDADASIRIVLDVEQEDPYNVLFVEVEDSQGKSISIGSRSKDDKFTYLTITASDIAALSTTGAKQ